jgi:hypothetical protein
VRLFDERRSAHATTDALSRRMNRRRVMGRALAAYLATGTEGS